MVRMPVLSLGCVTHIIYKIMPQIISPGLHTVNFMLDSSKKRGAALVLKSLLEVSARKLYHPSSPVYEIQRTVLLVISHLFLDISSISS